MRNEKKYNIATFSALKTTIVNGEEESVKELLANCTMLDIEKSYLIDLAKLNKYHAIVKLLEAVPARE